MSENLKILVLSPQSDKSNFDFSLMAPAPGPIRLAGYLRQCGFDSEYFDPNIPVGTGKGPTFEEKLQEKDWDMVGFSVLEDTLPFDLVNMHLARRFLPKARLVAGGIEAQFNYQTILDKSPCSIVIIGEGEVPMRMIAEGKPLHEIPGVTFKNNAIAMDFNLFNEATSAIEWENIRYEDYWDYYVDLYEGRMDADKKQEIHTVRVFSRNRCPIACKFCTSTNQLTWGSGEKVPVISASVDTLISVIERIADSHPRVESIYITDDDFCISKREVMRFCEKVIERDLGHLSFVCFARATDLNDELLTMMKQANFRRLNIGIDSFSEPVLQEMGKRCTLEQNHNALRLVKKHDIKAFINTIFVTPKTRLEDVEATVKATQAYLEDPFYAAGVNHAIIPFKGSEFYENYSDFLSHIQVLPEINQRIRRDVMIWAEDPYVREVQERYHFGVDEEVQRQAKLRDIVHFSATNTTPIKLEFMQRLIDEVREKYGLVSDSAVSVSGIAVSARG